MRVKCAEDWTGEIHRIHLLSKMETANFSETLILAHNTMGP
jgi:hypothetical protein